MSTNNFATGQTVPLSIPLSVRREWDMNRLTAADRAEIEAEHGNSRGYEFEWGQIIEEWTEPIVGEVAGESSEPVPTWHFVLADLHNEFLDGGGNLGELADLALNFLADCKEDAVAELAPEARAEALPDYICFEEGNNISAFDITVYGAQNIERATQWVDSFFIPGVLPLPIDRMREENQNASLPEPN